ncbi:MAG: SGNH/GDSL hydrolase family protein [Bacteroidales bacterium]|nr:SGNH/GDSL hydrolase family protein [Bacteroidales bacterium]
MNRKLIVFLTLAAIVCSCAAPKVHRENIEWSDDFIVGTSKTDLPHVLLIGDSYTRGYYERVVKALEGKAYVSRITNSRCLGDPLLVKEIKIVLKEQSFDVIHFNNGLHGWDYTEDEYAAAFPSVLRVLKKSGASIIWANTTSLFAPELVWKNPRIAERNARLLPLVQKEGIPVDDLASLFADHPEYFEGTDGMHPNAAGYDVLAASVVESILKALDQNE